MPELRAKFTADDSDIQSKASRLDRTVGRLGSRIAGAFSVYAVANFAREIANTTGALADMSDSTGVSPRSIQAFSALGEAAGVSAEKIEMALNRITSARTEAIADPTGSAAKQFAKMGVELRDLEGMSADQTIEAVARAARNGADDFEKMAAVQDMVGVRSKRMLTVLRQLGEQGFGTIAAQAEKAGAIIDDSTVRSIDAMGDAVVYGARVAKSRGAGFLGYLGKLVGMSPDDYTDENERLKRMADLSRSLRAQDFTNPGTVARKTAPESNVSRKLREAAESAMMKQTFSMGNVSDAMVRIGGARGVDFVGQQLNVLRSMDASLKKIAGQPAGLGW